MINNAVFGKTMQNVRKYRDGELVTTEKRRNYLESEPSHHTTMFFYRKCIGYKNEKNSNTDEKPVSLGLSILESSKIAICNFWYDYVKPKYVKKAKLCNMDADSFIVYIKTDYIYVDVAKDVEIRFDTSNYELNRPLPKGKKKKVISVMKDKIGRKISYLTDDSSEDKKVNDIKKVS